MRIVALAAAIWMAALPAGAADLGYAVGDRVVANPFSDNWLPCVVTEVQRNGPDVALYRLDCQYNNEVRSYGMPADPARFRDAGAAPPPLLAGPAAPAWQVFGAPRAPYVCNGLPPGSPAEIDRDLIVSLVWCTTESSNSTDLKTVLIDIHGLSFEPPERWEDHWTETGLTHGGPGTWIYPVDVAYTQHWYSSSGHNVGERQATWYCYFTDEARWRCIYHAEPPNQEPMHPA